MIYPKPNLFSDIQVRYAPQYVSVPEYTYSISLPGNHYYSESTDTGRRGFGDMMVDDGFVDDFEGFDDEMLNAEPIPAERAVTSQPYIISIENTSSADVRNVKILGPNQNLVGINNYGNPESINITMGISNITYAEFLLQIQAQPFTVGMSYLQSSNASQVLQPFNISHRDANGSIAMRTVVPTLDPYAQMSTIVPIRSEHSVDGNTEYTITILANSRLQLYLYPRSRINIQRGSARPIEQMYSAPSIIRNPPSITNTIVD